ncbi:MerR family transcriptional regulator [Enterococcus sp. AZ196]|uniref:MerR family transcriptional regulator n=1 Tax=Enterococcus sp. AZ196 TaxID=2774659 RepID=UPI003D272AFD
MYTIKQVSELLNISKVTLRYYDRIGILKASRSANSYRTYNEKDIHILRNIVVFKQAGFSLEDIQILTSLYSLKEGNDCNDLAKEVITRNLNSMQLQLLFLKKVTAILEELLPLFQTHELYKINQQKLDTSIMNLFEEVRQNQLEAHTNDEKR